MIKNISYHKDTDSLYFDNDVLGFCEIDKDGDLNFDTSDESHYIPMKELEEIVKLYKNRKRRSRKITRY